MSAGDKVFAGSIPENYDRYMVPLIFAGYARDLAQRAAALSPKAVLETAAGSGAVTRALAPNLASDARYVVTDFNQPMLDYAATRQHPDNRISWRQADAQALPFEDATFDLVCCQFGVMFFPDRIAAYREARRVLAPGGRLVFNTWDRLEANVLAERVHRLVAGRFPDDPPAFVERVPHGYHDAERIRSDLAAAGIAAVTIDRMDAMSSPTSARDVAIGFCQGTPLRNELESRGADMEAVTAEVEAAIAGEFGREAVSAPIGALVVTAQVQAAHG